jgi:hypothetical protein
MRSNLDTFENVQPVLHAKVPIIRSRHRRLHIEIDISLHNMLVNIIKIYSFRVWICDYTLNENRSVFCKTDKIGR